MQRWEKVVEEFCEGRNSDTEEAEEGCEGGLADTKEEDRNNMWELVKEFTKHTRPDLKGEPEIRQHIFLNDFLEWGAKLGEQRGWNREDVTRWSKNVTYMIDNCEMLTREGNNVWLEYLLDD